MSSSDFKHWDERYGEDVFFYGTAPNDFLKETSTLLKPKSAVLCLAEGEGRNAIYLAECGHAVTGVDGSSVGLSKMTALAAKRGVSVSAVCADLSQYDLGHRKWDAIVSIWCHLPSTLRKKVYAECVRALKPGGILILEAYTPRQLQFGTGGPKDLDLLPTLTQLQEELVGLTFSHAKECDRTIHEGKGHGGQSAVVQVVAKKL